MHRLSEAVEGIAEAILPEESVPGVYRQAVGAETENATTNNDRQLRSSELVELRSTKVSS